MSKQSFLSGMNLVSRWSSLNRSQGVFGWTFVAFEIRMR